MSADRTLNEKLRFCPGECVIDVHSAEDLMFFGIIVSPEVVEKCWGRQAARQYQEWQGEQIRRHDPLLAAHQELTAAAMLGNVPSDLYALRG